MNSATPVMQLPTTPQDPNASSFSCTVSLMVTNSKNQGSSCSATISSKACNKDCLGVINGTAIVDSCGLCNGDGKSCRDCSGTPFGNLKLDACNECGGTITDPANCNVINKCITVEASVEILAYEQRLIKQAKTLVKKFSEEDKRNKKNKCGITTTTSKESVNSAYQTIKEAGKDIFSQGVEICGNNCITVSYADQVLKLIPEFKVIESKTTSLAKQVQACYKRKRIRTDQKIPGVKTTVKVVQSELKKLIKDCQDKEVCP